MLGRIETEKLIKIVNDESNRKHLVELNWKIWVKLETSSQIASETGNLLEKYDTDGGVIFMRRQYSQW